MVPQSVMMYRGVPEAKATEANKATAEHKRNFFINVFWYNITSYSISFSEPAPLDSVVCIFLVIKLKNIFITRLL